MRRLALLGAVTLLATPSFGADQVGQIYITPFGGALVTDNDRLLDDHHPIYGIAVGKHFSQAWSGEFNFNQADLDASTGASAGQHRAFTVDVLRVFNRDSRFAPYLSIGAGGLEPHPGGEGDEDFVAQAGVGAFLKLWEDDTRSVSLRPEIKARWDDAGADGSLVDYIGVVGLQVSFGGARPVPVVAPVPPPAPVAQVAPPPPPPAPVDADNDGVIDSRDQCLGTPAGSMVDTVGCPQRGAITLRGVTFETNSANLTADSRPVLAGVAGDLKKYPRLRVEMQGHTDSVGSEQYNLGLSQRRADSVRTFLLNEGVPAERVTAKGYGEDQPAADNKTAEGRSQNRRVVMSVVDNPGEVRVQGEGAVR